MISTATAAVNANVALSPVPSQKPSVATASAITIGTKTPEIRSASRWTGALPVWASVTSRPICASAVSAPTRVARTTSRPPALTVAPATSSPGSTLDRHGLAGEQRLVDRRAALLDDAVGGDLLARADDEAVADGELLDRDAARPVERASTSLAPELEQRLQRGAGAALGARLEVAAGEDEGGDDRGRLEVDVVRALARAAGTRSKLMRMPGIPASPKNSAYSDHSQAESVPRLISVSIVAVPWRRFAQAARWNGQAPQSTTGVASLSASHCQLSNCSAGIIETSRTGSERTRGEISRKRSGAVSSGSAGASALVGRAASRW